MQIIAIPTTDTFLCNSASNRENVYSALFKKKNLFWIWCRSWRMAQRLQKTNTTHWGDAFALINSGTFLELKSTVW